MSDETCHICNQPLEGETTLTGPGEAHVECVQNDPFHDSLP